MIKYIIISTFNHLSFEMFCFINSYQFILIVFIVLMIGIINYVWRRKGIKKIISINLLVIFLLTLPYFSFYKRGKNINDLFDCGYKIGICLEKYYLQNNCYPKSINELLEFHCLNYNTDFILDNYKYEYFNFIKMNDDHKNEKGYKLKEKDYYYLKIVSKIFFDEYYIYDKEVNKFILRD